MMKQNVRALRARIFVLAAAVSLFFAALHVSDVTFTSLPVSELSSWQNYATNSIEDKLLSLGNHVSTVASVPESWKPTKTFTRQALRNDVYPDPYNGKPLRRLCKKTVWREGLFFTNGLVGGIGNIRPGLLGLIRVAIESGAGLVLPVVHPRTGFGDMRDSFDWDVEHAKKLELFFDMAHFVSTLKHDCPELIVIDESDEDAAKSWNLPNITDHIPFANKLLLPSHWGNVLQSPEQWRPAFDNWLNETMMSENITAISRKNPMRVRLSDPAFFWPTNSNGPDFEVNFGRVLRSPQRIREVSARVLYRLYKTVGITEAPDHMPAGGYFGVHMRTDADATYAGWASYELQRDTLRINLIKSNLSDIYVATGDATVADRLREDFGDLEIPVNDTHTTKVRIFQKTDFLEPEDDTADLSWDQLGLIDVEVMMRGTKFLGITTSSWSWLLALKRHAWSHQNPYDFAKNPQAFEDEFSVIGGGPGSGTLIPATMWI